MRRGLPHLPGLDAVRAIAVAAVLLFHLPGRPLVGGFLGVDVFFVLSGFLITSLLLLEVSSSGGIAFGKFYLRRARRLLPALFFMLAGTGVLVLLFARDAAAQFRTDVLAAITYTSNWWYIVDERSYFEAAGRPPLLQHLWSLGVEEQFYLVWPIVLLLLYRRWGRRGVLWGAVAGVVASTALMASLAVARGHPGRGRRGPGVLRQRHPRDERARSAPRSPACCAPAPSRRSWPGAPTRCCGPGAWPA